MTSRADEFREKADEFESMAARITDSNAKQSYIELAKTWRELADKIEKLDRVAAEKRLD